MRQSDIVRHIIMGEAEKLDMRPQVEQHLADLRTKLESAKARGVQEHSAFIMALALLSQEVQDE